ncbi:DUF475 domain-containing protein [Methylomonas sp. AM2-LC]|uniref:DUF475 domain-containing protein n=1 Tax=Methylomonas sp. AM2-LC TaxID=3153301 RepID=UPI003267B135
MRYFLLPNLLSFIGVCVIWWFYGWNGAIKTVLLILIEGILSVDNSVVNVTTLKTMPPKYQRAFMTWGWLIAVVGMRFIFPVGIVSATTEMNFVETIQLAFNHGEEYKDHVEGAKTVISSFGAIFMILIGIKFLLADKEVYWFEAIEKKFQGGGGIEAVEVLVASIISFVVWVGLDGQSARDTQIGCETGILVFLIVTNCIGSLVNAFCKKAGLLAASGLSGFIYLEFQDASFSFDGTIGAFAVTPLITIMLVGLGCGAGYVRAMTLYLLKEGVIDQYRYLEHGAHYAVLSLGIMMLIGIKFPVHEVVTSGVGLGIIALSVYSSIRFNRKKAL